MLIHARSVLRDNTWWLSTAQKYLQRPMLDGFSAETQINYPSQKSFRQIFKNTSWKIFGIMKFTENTMGSSVSPLVGSIKAGKIKNPGYNKSPFLVICLTLCSGGSQENRDSPKYLSEE